MGGVERPGSEFAAEQALPLKGARQPKRAGLLCREAEASIKGLVADQKDGAMPAPPRRAERAPHQSGADAAAAARLIDRERAEQQSRPRRPGTNRPQPHRADEALVYLGHERESFSWNATFAQPLRGFLETRRAPYAIK